MHTCGYLRLRMSSDNPHVSGAGTLDANARRSLTAFARAFLLKDTAVDPAVVSWNQLPCVGIADLVCKVQTAMAC